MNKKKESLKKKKLYKCYVCGYISENYGVYCPKCQTEGLKIHLQLMMEK